MKMKITWYGSEPFPGGLSLLNHKMLPGCLSLNEIYLTKSSLAMVKCTLLVSSLETHAHINMAVFHSQKCHVTLKWFVSYWNKM